MPWPLHTTHKTHSPDPLHTNAQPPPPLCYPHSLRSSQEDEDGEEDDLLRRRNLDPDEEIVVPPSTLAVDIGGALGESEYADIKFVANGKPIYAHRCILAARSAYFSSMFRSIEMSGGKKNKVVEVVVPDR